MSTSIPESDIPESDIPEAVVQILLNGGLIIFPTETVYGLGCLATREDALRRLYEVKGRTPDQPPPVLVADDEQLHTLVGAVPDDAAAMMKTYWPGSLTLVLPARDDLSPLLTGCADDGHTPTIGVRMTGHPVARELCRLTGTPLVATSANFSRAKGRAAHPCCLDDIAAELRAGVDAVLDSGDVGGVPSTVVDYTSHPPRVVRHGAVEVPEL